MALRELFHPLLRLRDGGIGHENAQQAVGMVPHAGEQVVIVLRGSPTPRNGSFREENKLLAVVDGLDDHLARVPKLNSMF